MSYHENKEINSAIIQLLDSLCTWERMTGQGSVLIMMPVMCNPEKILMAQDGKPIEYSSFHFKFLISQMTREI